MTAEEKKEEKIRLLQDKIKLLEFDAKEQNYKIQLLKSNSKSTRKTLLKMKLKLEEIKKLKSYNELDKVIAMIKNMSTDEEQDDWDGINNRA